MLFPMSLFYTKMSVKMIMFYKVQPERYFKINGRGENPNTAVENHWDTAGLKSLVEFESDCALLLKLLLFQTVLPAAIMFFSRMGKILYIFSYSILLAVP